MKHCNRNHQMQQTKGNKDKDDRLGARRRRFKSCRLDQKAVNIRFSASYAGRSFAGRASARLQRDAGTRLLFTTKSTEAFTNFSAFLFLIYVFATEQIYCYYCMSTTWSNLFLFFQHLLYYPELQAFGQNIQHKQ